MKTLIVTEKPKVSQRIARALSPNPIKKSYRRVPYFSFKENGNEVYVTSAAGHLYSLKQDSEGYSYPVFDVSWEPLHNIEKSKYYTRNYIDALKSISKDVEQFILATDWDIEGELLGFNALRFSLKITDAKRMRFSTLLYQDLRKAYEDLDDVDLGLVDAGEARHILDWYWGINISRALMHATRLAGGKYTISAGRVQTPALAILVKREREISAFVPEKFFELFASLKVKQTSVKAEHRHGRFDEREDAEKALKESSGEEAIVKDIERKEIKRPPPVPFDLGELQSESYRIFRYSPKRTQEIAQTLYEGGLISYPRTSSQKYPLGLGFRRIIENISKIPGFEKAKALLVKKKLFPRQGKKDDPAHPAIYPTGQKPERIKGDEEKIYKLIVHRFLSLFEEAALLQTTTVDVTIGTQPFFFSALQKISEGWMEFYPYVKVDEKILPEIKTGDKIRVIKVEIKEGETKPPKRYNPASLIRELEEKALGTKATRADIVETLYRRGYVSGVPIKVTDAGVAVISALEKYVPQIIDEELTRRFEDYIKKIQQKETSKENVLKEARSELVKLIKEFKEKEKDIGRYLGGAFAETRRKREVLGKCPKCGGELRIVRSKKTGKSFVGCSNYPSCQNSYPLPQKTYVSPSDKICSACGLPLVRINFGGRRVLSCIDMNCRSKQKR